MLQISQRGLTMVPPSPPLLAPSSSARELPWCDSPASPTIRGARIAGARAHREFAAVLAPPPACHGGRAVSSIRPLATIMLLAVAGFVLYVKITETEPVIPDGVGEYEFNVGLDSGMDEPTAWSPLQGTAPLAAGSGGVPPQRTEFCTPGLGRRHSDDSAAVHERHGCREYGRASAVRCSGSVNDARRRACSACDAARDAGDPAGTNQRLGRTGRGSRGGNARWRRRCSSRDERRPLRRPSAGAR